MIGVGVTTHKRPEVFKVFIKQFRKHTPDDIKLIFYNDRSGKGISYAKNQVLKQMKSCDHAFLFDDDCFPIMDKWWEPYIEASQKSGNNHLLYLTQRNTDLRIQAISSTGIYQYDKPLGCMLYMTKKAIRHIGAFDERFKKYGYEHINYSKRIFHAGLNPDGPYLGISDPQPIYSMDVDGVPEEYRKQIPFFRSSVQGIEFYKERNLYLLNQPIEQCHIPL